MFNSSNFVLDAAVEFAPDAPLLDWLGLGAGLDIDGVVAEGIHAENLQRREDVVLELGVLAHSLVNALEHADDLVHVLAIGHADVEDVIGVFLGHVGHDINLAVADEMHAAGLVAQNDHAEGDFFHEAAFVANLDHVAHAHLVFQQDEKSADEILDQVLRAEAHCQADHAGGREDGSNGDSQFAQEHERGHREDHQAQQPVNHPAQRAGSLLIFDVARPAREQRLQPFGQDGGDLEQDKGKNDNENDLQAVVLKPDLHRFEISLHVKIHRSPFQFDAETVRTPSGSGGFQSGVSCTPGAKPFMQMTSGSATRKCGRKSPPPPVCCRWIGRAVIGPVTESGILQN